MKNISFYSFLVLFLLSSCGESLQPLSPGDSNLDYLPPTHQIVTLQSYSPVGGFNALSDLLKSFNTLQGDSDFNASLTRKSNSLTLNILTDENEERSYCIYYVIFNETSDCLAPNSFGGLCAGGAKDYDAPSLSVIKSCGADNSFDNFGIITDVLSKKDQKDGLMFMGDDLVIALENPMGAEVGVIIKFNNQTNSLIGVFPSPNS